MPEGYRRGVGLFSIYDDGDFTIEDTFIDDALIPLSDYVDDLNRSLSSFADDNGYVL